MPIPSTIADLSTTAASNSPAGSDSPTDGDNFIRALSAFIRQTYNALPGVTPAAYGAVLDGTTDDTAAVLLWLAAAESLGLWADGLGATIAVTGDLDISTFTALKLRDVTFKQLSPASATRKTLYALANDGIHLQRVKVLRNGDGTSGSLLTAAGIWLQDCDDATIEQCEVSGNDKGCGIVAWNCARVNIVRPYVHDIRYAHVAESDDVIQGLWVNLCDNFTLSDPRVEMLGRIDQTSAARDRYNRGIAVSGCRGGLISNPQVYRADQGIDVTGSAGNSNIVVEGGNIRHVYSVGVKFANSATACRATGVSVEHAGFYGFHANGPVSSQLNATQNVGFDGCTARNIGSAQQYTASNIKGFSAERGTGSVSPYTAYPKAVKFRNCDAVSDEGSVVVSVASTTALTLATPLPCSLGVRVRFTTTGTLPTGLALATDYWLVPVKDTMTTGVATSYINAQDGTVVSTLAGGSGTHTMTLFQNMYDGFYQNVSPTDMDTGNPNTTENCRSSGHTNKAFNGMHAPVVISTRTAQSIGDGAYEDAKPDNDVSDSMNLHDATTPGASFLVPFSGDWRLDANAIFAANSAGTRRIKVQVDTTGTGSSYADAGPLDIRDNLGASTATTVEVDYENFLPRGTLLKAMLFQDSGGALNCDVRISLRPASVYGGTI